MAEVPTVDIQSPRDPGVKWIINESDYDPAKHVLWGTPVVEPVTESVQPSTGMRPSVPDYIYDENGDIIAVNIINPQRRNERTQVRYEQYDPDVHQLWSMHPRFN